MQQALKVAAENEHQPEERRIHFHVPVFQEQLGLFQNTQDFLRDLLDAMRRKPICRHLEVETYAWSVLPSEVRSADVIDSIMCELKRVIERLRERYDVASYASRSTSVTGSMFLNDAFDREIDASERPDRPIPSGLAGARSVLGLGFGMLALGAVLLLAYVLVLTWIAKLGAPPRRVMPLIAGISLLDALLLAILGNPLVAGPAVLGFPATVALQRYVQDM